MPTPKDKYLPYEGPQRDWKPGDPRPAAAPKISRRQEKKNKSEKERLAREKRMSEIAKSQKDLCWFCNEPMGYDCTREHLLARARGGGNERENLRAAHGSCNSAAGHLSVAKKYELRRIGQAAGRDAVLEAAHRMRREETYKAFRVTRTKDGEVTQPPGYWAKLGLKDKPRWWDG